MIALTIRNLKVFFRDRTSVFFSLLAVFIIIGLYVLFLGDTVTSSMSGMKDPRFLVDSWIMAGLLGVTSITTTMGAFGTMVEDKTKKIAKDFAASPISRSKLAASYILSAFLVGVIMCIVTFILAEIYIVAYGGQFLSLTAVLKVLGFILLSVLANSALVFFIVSFFKSTSAFATASTVIGTLIGFLTGVYIPVGSLPESIQYVVKLFPVSHAGALFRQVMMERPMADSFAGAPADVIESFKHSMGITFTFGDTSTTMLTSILVLIATAVVFYGLSILSLSRKSRI